MSTPTKDLIKKTVKTIKMWVKTWYFDIETESKYIFSRRLFFHWLKSLSGNILTELAVSKISLWINTNIDPYSSYSLNYHRLHVNGFSAITTSNAESMHNSMKSKSDGAKAKSCVHESADKMMDKAQRKGKNIELLNASVVSTTRTLEIEDRGDRRHFLIKYAYKNLNKNCH